MCNRKEEHKKVFYTEILSNKEIAGGVYSMMLKYPEAEIGRAAPGKFVNVYLNSKDLLLPRPISICQIDSDQIKLVYKVVGTGTKELAAYPAGLQIRVSSPLGNGYDLSAPDLENKYALVVGGGIGIPPLLELTRQLRAMGVTTRVVLGFKDETFLVDEFRKVGATVFIATDDGSKGFHGSVTELMEGEDFTKDTEDSRADICFTCGPAPMLKAITGYCIKNNIKVQTSLEERMGCGFGACVGCVCKIKSKDGIIQKKVCTDGPVFRGEEVVWDD